MTAENPLNFKTIKKAVISEASQVPERRSRRKKNSIDCKEYFSRHITVAVNPEADFLISVPQCFKCLNVFLVFYWGFSPTKIKRLSSELSATLSGRKAKL